MEIIYELIQKNPKYFAWAFGLVNVLWGMFIYFNKQSHDKKMEKLKYSLRLKLEENLPLMKKLSELEELAGEAKEIVTSHKAKQLKREEFSSIYKKLDQLAGHFSKHPRLMQSIRDLNQYGAIMVQNDPHDPCRDDVLNFYKTLIIESENIKRNITA
ncbi:MAG: hypothetical protein JRD69_08415 [Deltaproteobacteria bacterium]|nr:hypothetical protein [Deltaproteobacteria bacterium]